MKQLQGKFPSSSSCPVDRNFEAGEIMSANKYFCYASRNVAAPSCGDIFKNITGEIQHIDTLRQYECRAGGR